MERRCNYRLLLLFFALFFSIAASASPQVTTYQARIVKPDGLPLETSNVNFKFSVLNPAADCVLYAETFSAINMANSAGIISFTLGSGVKTYPASATTFAQVFNNSTPALSCEAGGPPNYSPQSFDVRKVVMQFNDGAGWQTLPAMSINAVPYSIYSGDSLRLGGVSATNFVQYSTIPTCAASEALHYNGSGFNCVNVASGGGASGTITSGDVTTALGYTPANTSIVGTSFSTVTATLSSLISSQTTLTSTVSTLSASYSALSASMTTFTGSQWTASATDIFYTFGNVGIGTSTPVTKLDVVGGIRISMESATCAAGLAGTLRYNSGIVEYCNGTSWTAFGVSGAGILAINGLTSGSQTFAMGTTGTQPNVSSTGTVHTFNFPYASVATTTAGLISYSDYTNFTNKITSSAVSIAQVLGYTPASVSALGNYLVKANNLDDLASSATARSNLGLGTIALLNSVDLGTSNASGTLAIARLPSFIGDVASSAASNTLILSNSGVTAGTYTKVTVDAKGRVTSSSALASSDVTTALGYTPVSAAASSQWNTSGTTINYVTGNVGIGTSNPTSVVHIGGAPVATYNYGLVSIGNGSFDGSSSGFFTGNANGVVHAINTATGFTGEFAHYQNGASDARFIVKSNGSVVSGRGSANGTLSSTFGGLNTANGSQAFAVGHFNNATGNYTFTSGLFDNATGDNSTAMGYSVTANSLGMTALGINNVVPTGVSINTWQATDPIFVIGNGQGSAPASASTAMTVLKNGNVGIGTTTPMTKLDVSGGVRISMESAACAVSYAGTLRYNSGNVEYCNGTTWSAFGIAGSGLANFNGSTSTTQTLATGSGGTAPLFLTVNGVHTINIPNAASAAVTAGLLANTDYQIFTNKMNATSGAVISALGYTPASVTANVMATYQVRVATSANITLSGNQTIDGISVVAGDRVLVKNQSAQQENGVYVANAGAWTRAADINSWEKTIGYKAHVTEGAAWEGMTFSSNTSVGGTLDSTPFEFSSVGSTNISLNTAQGFSALGANTTGTTNAAYGPGTLALNTTGSANTANGFRALYSNSTGSYNTANGASSLFTNISGSYNTANGYRTLYFNTGNNNTATGHRSLYLNSTGNNNTATGYNALTNMTDGSNNTGIGFSAGSAITTGSNNVVIGSNTGSSFATDSNNISISDGSGNERIRVVSNGNVGIGTSLPSAQLHLAAGTASTASLKLTSGALVTSPQSGTIEYDGFNLYYTDGANTRRTITSVTEPGTYENVSTISSTGNITMVPVGSVVVSSTTASTNSQTGALVVKGGVGVTGDINASGTVNATVGLVTPLVVGSNASSGSLTLNSTTHANKGNIFISPQDAGKVAIGNVDPLVGLHVQKPGPLNLVALFQAGASSGSIALGTNATYPASGGQVQGLDGSGAAGTLVLNAIGGNVGVGTAAPLAPLHIKRPVGSGQSLLLEGDSATTGTPKLTFLDTNGGSTQGHIGFDATNGFSMMGGKVGIGTVTPAGVLEIHTPDATPNILLSRTAMATKWAIRNSNNGVSDTLLIGDNANNLSGITIEASGHVGIGLTTPAATLDVSGAIRISDDQTACSSGNKGAMRFNQSTNIFEMCDGTSWNASASADLIPASSIVLMSSCPVGWTNNGLAAAGGPGAVTCSGVTCSLCQAPSASLVPANSNMLMESCPSGWTTMGKAAGPGRSGYTLGGSIVDFVTCQSPAISSVMPKGGRLIMQFCPAAWNDLGDTGTGQVLATCGAIPCRVCEVPGGVANPRVLYGGTASSSAVTGSEVSIIGGRGGSISGPGGTVFIRGGMANEGFGGSVFINAGVASTTTNTSYTGASIFLTAGNGVVSGAGGRISLTAGASADGTFEDIDLQSTGGRVGIGTTNAEQRLHVTGNSMLFGALQTNISAYASGGIRLTGNGGASQEAISFWGGNSGGGAAIAFRRDDNLGSYLDFYTDDTGFGNITHAATLNNLGHFGVGTASPTTRLHVANSSTVTNAVATLESTGAGGRPYMKFRGDGADMGYVGYGSTAQPNLILMNYVSGPTYLGTNSIIRMSITSSGAVGIGTQTPENLLDVAGIAQVNYLKVDASDAISEGGEIQLMGSGAYGNIQLDNFQGNFRVHTLAAGKQIQILGGTLSVEGTGGKNYFASNVGIGNSNPLAELDITGDGRATGTFATWSDLRTKKNIKVIPDSLNKILRLRGVGFDWRTDEFPDKKFKTTPDIGVIAQEVEKVFPEVVKTASDGYKSVGYAQLVAPLIEAVKELYYKITGVEHKIDRTVASIEAKKADKTEVDALKAENAELKSRLDRLEKMILNQQKSK